LDCFPTIASIAASIRGSNGLVSARSSAFHGTLWYSTTSNSHTDRFAMAKHVDLNQGADDWTLTLERAGAGLLQPGDDGLMVGHVTAQCLRAACRSACAIASCAAAMNAFLSKSG